MSSTNLNVTVARAISFLTTPLCPKQTDATIRKLQSILEANLIAHCAPSWSVKDPKRGSGRRCLTLSPACLPPRSIYAGCLATGVQWFSWIEALGGREFDLCIDPGCVSIKFTTVSAAGPSYKTIIVWADEVVAPPLPTPRTGLAGFSDAQNAAVCSSFYGGSKTMAQQLLEEDEEDEHLLSMIAEEVNGPIRVASISTQFGASTRSPSPLSSISGYSRCSSRSSNSSNSSGSDMLSSASSYASHSHFIQTAESKQRREQKPKVARVFVDTTKNEVTPYDGGKTTVLTGGVMLGGGLKIQKPTKKLASPSSASNSWRSVRA